MKNLENPIWWDMDSHTYNVVEKNTEWYSVRRVCAASLYWGFEENLLQIRDMIENEIDDSPGVWG